MRIITSPSGQEQTVAVRRSESADAQAIDSLIITGSATAAEGRVNVIHLLEKANLALTLSNERDDILAHASFFDHPVGGLVDQARWETFLQKHFRAEECTPLNTLFLHLFVAEPNFAAASVKEIMRAAFNAVVELEHVCLLSPNVACFRVEDTDDILQLVSEQTKLLSGHRPYFLSELIESQSQESHAAVCESDGAAVGFISVTSDVDLKQLQENFDLSEFDGLYKRTKTTKKKKNRETQSR
ncbi:Cilia- and flagella-associated protein 61 [Larimichthys crocea]|uniref:Uncharacterized protein n=1 Tax=Larimichthys crocea TaxID=215358 RepID=A0ACD3QZ62_LARCR|nr:Cilia- and flagella-associated protein 61 [Larimichthys crocea]